MSSQCLPFPVSVLCHADLTEVDAVVLHAGTNNLEGICDNILQLERTLRQHRQLILEAQATYPGLPIVISAVLPRFDE